MRYLITIDNVDPNTALIAEQAVQLREQVVIPTWNECAKLEAENKIVAGGVAAGSEHSILIVEAASLDELNQLVQGLPAWGRLKIAVTPLQDFSETVAQQRGQQPSATASDEPPNREIHKHLGQLRDLAGK